MRARWHACAALAGVGLAASSVSVERPSFEFSARKHSCGVCRELQQGRSCWDFGACHVVNDTSALEGCEAFCPQVRARRALTALGPAQKPAMDLRVAKGFGTKPYGALRVSVISHEPEPPQQGFFDYSAAFKYKWTQFYLHSTTVDARPGEETPLSLGDTAVTLRLPAQREGVAGLLIADPCVHAPTHTWIPCEYADAFQTTERTVELINTFVPDNSTDFWGIVGDNFYDRNGIITESVFERISLEAKSKIFMTVPGNHDYWVMGSPAVASWLDQCANGHMQFYAQDVKAAEGLMSGNSSAPFDFSVDPHRLGVGCNLPASSNAFWYNQVGNVAFVGQSGAYSLEEAMPFMKEACAWLSQQTGVEVALLLGHWDVVGLGASREMAMPEWYEEMSALRGCAEFHQQGLLKFVMGHTHCNDPHPHGQVGAGFRVAGFGMEGCRNYGVPMFDTTGGRVRFWYFDASTDDSYDAVVSCVRQKGWRSCTGLAELWLDQPLGWKEEVPRALFA